MNQPSRTKMDVRTMPPTTNRTNAHHRNTWYLRRFCRRNFLLRSSYAPAAGARYCAAHAAPEEYEQTSEQPNLKVKFFRRV